MEHAVFGNVGRLGSNFGKLNGCFYFFVAYLGDILCAKNAKTKLQKYLLSEFIRCIRLNASMIKQKKKDT